MDEIVLALVPGQTPNFSWDEPNLVSELSSWKVRRLAYLTLGYKEGGGGWNPSPEFLISFLQYFETILSSVESLWSASHDEIYFMGGGAAGGLWRHQQWSPSWILLRIRNQLRTARNGNFFVLEMNNNTSISIYHHRFINKKTRLTSAEVTVAATSKTWRASGRSSLSQSRGRKNEALIANKVNFSLLNKSYFRVIRIIISTKSL